MKDKKDSGKISNQQKKDMEKKEKIGIFRRVGKWLELDLSKPLRTAPHFGMRIVKTGIAVLAVFFCYLFVKRPENGILLAMIATVASMQDTVSRSLRAGVIRLIGTALGGLFGILFIWASNYVGVADQLVIIAIANSFGVMLCIGICAWLGFGEGAVISCVVFTAIYLNAAGDAPYLYAGNRMVDTAIGIVIAVIVNMSIRRPKDRANDKERSKPH